MSDRSRDELLALSAATRDTLFTAFIVVAACCAIYFTLNATFNMGRVNGLIECAQGHAERPK